MTDMEKDRDSTSVNSGRDKGDGANRQERDSLPATRDKGGGTFDVPVTGGSSRPEVNASLSSSTPSDRSYAPANGSAGTSDAANRQAGSETGEQSALRATAAPGPNGDDSRTLSGGPASRSDAPGATEQQKDQQIRQDLETHAGKSFNDLVLALGRGPISITPSELKNEMTENGIYHERPHDQGKGVAIDEVHTFQKVVGGVGYNDTVTRVTTEERIEAEKEASQRARTETVLGGLSSGLDRPKSTK